MHQRIRRLASLPRLDYFANDCIDCSLVLLLFLTPLLMGGRHPVGEWAYLVAILPGSVGLAIRCLRGDHLPLPGVVLALLAVALAVPLLQSIPLHPAWIAATGPRAELLAFKSDATLWPTPLQHTLSLVPTASRQAFLMMAGYTATFMFLISRLKSRADAERVLWMVAVSAGLLAVVAMFQATLGNDRFVWIYEHPSRDPGSIPRGPFQNENHLCNVLAVSLPLCIYFIIKPFVHLVPLAGSAHRRDAADPSATAPRGRTRDQWLAAASLISISSTVYATPSRGGAAIVACGAVIMGGLLLWRGIFGMVGSGLRKPFLACSAIACVLVTVLGIGAVLWKVPELSPWRWRIWVANVAMFSDFPVLGTGAGTHRFVYRPYLQEYFPQTFTHAESSWLQILSETGAVGFLLLLLAAGYLMRKLAIIALSELPRRDVLLVSAITASILVSGIHACFDFCWHIPACVVPLLVLAAVAVRFPALRDLSDYPPPAASTSPPVGEFYRIFPIAFSSLLVLLIGGAIYSEAGTARAAMTWDGYRRLVREVPDESIDAEGNDRHIQLLRLCLASDPYHIQARIRLTHHLYLRSKTERTDSVRADLAKQVIEQAKLVAFLCPTHSEAPLLAAAAYADSGSPIATRQALLRHSLKLRPCDGRTLARLAVLAMMEADLALADDYWRRAIHAAPDHYEETFTYLLLFYSPQQVLDKFAPDLSAAEYLLQKVGREGPSEGLPVLLAYVSDAYVTAAKADPRDMIAEQHFETAFRYATQTNEVPRIIDVLHKRIDRNPTILANRLTLARYLLVSGEQRELDEQLRACAQIAPGNHELRDLQMAADRAVISQLQSSLEQR